MEIDFGQVQDGQNYLKTGRYFCVITDAVYDQSTHGDWGYKVTLTCASGEHAGKTVIDRLWATWAGSPQHALVARLKILARETGLLKDPNGKTTIMPESLIDRELYVTVVAGKPYISKKTGKEVKPHQVDFAGYEAAAQRPADFVPQAVTRPTPLPAPAGSAVPGGYDPEDLPF